MWNNEKQLITENEKPKRESGKNLSFQDMIKGQVRKAALLGGILVLILGLIIGLVLGFVLIPGVMMNNLIMLIVIVLIADFIAGFITVYVIMNMAIKQLVATFMPAPKTEKKK